MRSDRFKTPWYDERRLKPLGIVWYVFVLIVWVAMLVGHLSVVAMIRLPGESPNGFVERMQSVRPDEIRAFGFVLLFMALPILAPLIVWLFRRVIKTRSVLRARVQQRTRRAWTGTGVAPGRRV
jgi:hypothetical protein